MKTIPINLKNQALKKVYEAVGSRERLREIVGKFYEKMSKDLLIGYFFEGKDLSHIADQQTLFLLRAIGVTQEYKGKPPALAHTKIPNILKGHFDRRLVLLKETLEEAGLDQQAIEIWLRFEEQFRDSIVVEEGPGRRNR